MQGDGQVASAQGIKQITIGNRKVWIGPLVFNDFASAKEMAAEDAKRSLILTYTKNPDLVAMLPKEVQSTILQDAFLRAEKITADSLPMKKVWAPKRSTDNGKVMLNEGERFFHKETGQWIEKGKPLLAEMEVEYSGWWMSETTAGKVFGLWLAMKKCPGQEQVTLDEVTALAQSAGELEEAANKIGEISQPTLGNS